MRSEEKLQIQADVKHCSPEAMRAAELLDVPPKELNEFNVLDSYNENQIEGFLCRRSDHRYGALVIHAVNGQPTKLQRILATPKLHYPFGTNQVGERIYNWGKIKRANVYEKFDGTNILCYSYANADGKRFTTFKTRLTPVLRADGAGDYGDFRGMWDEMLRKYPGLRDISFVARGDFSLSFEMYGYRNPILIEYEIPLDAVLLFAVRQEDASIYPSGYLFGGFEPIESCPFAKCLHKIGNPDEMTSVYNKLREEADAQNKKTDEGKVRGSEGFVFYILNEAGAWEMKKCKPEMIESIHWANDSISPNSILTTCWNALENVDVEELSRDFVIELLKEEFSDIQIAKSEKRVSKALKIVTDAVYFRRDVKKGLESLPEIYKDLDFEKHRRGIMRHLSQFFEKKQMRGVFTALKALGIVK